MLTKAIAYVKSDSDGDSTMVDNANEMDDGCGHKIEGKKRVEDPVKEVQILKDHTGTKIIKHLAVPKRKYVDDREHLQRHKPRKVGGKVHKETKPSNKRSNSSRKVKQIKDDKSESFYNGAILGSFLGAAVSTVITKFLTEGS